MVSIRAPLDLCDSGVLICVNAHVEGSSSTSTDLCVVINTDSGDMASQDDRHGDKNEHYLTSPRNEEIKECLGLLLNNGHFYNYIGWLIMHHIIQ
jgi:hypothetical protein